MRKGRTEEARKILDRLSDGSSNIDLQLQQISDTIALEDSYASNATYADCFRGGVWFNYRRRLESFLMGLWLQV